MVFNFNYYLQRLRADVAANVLQLFLWAPSSWIKSEYNPSSNEVITN